jgi:signal transduction histidine kinase
VIDTVQDMMHSRPDYEINVFHDAACMVNADKDRLNQVLVNLLSNAIKYSPEVKRIDVTVSAVKNTAMVRVLDWGIGIHGSELEKIFDRFYRAAGTNEQTYPGFGIGLFIAKEIIERHGGMISVKSEKNKGAEFTFSIPLENT